MLNKEWILLYVSGNVVICVEKTKTDLSFASNIFLFQNLTNSMKLCILFRLYFQDNLHILWYGIRSECKNTNVDLRKSTNEF